MNISEFKKNINNTWFDLENAILNPNMSDLIRSITTIDLTVKKMATTHIGLLISIAVSCLNDDECYVNIGTWNGYSFFAGLLLNPNKQCIGNDNFSLFNGQNSTNPNEKDKANRNFGDIRQLFYNEFDRIKTPNSIFVNQDWKVFLNNFRNITDKKIGFYFYDGGHDFCSQYGALKMVEPYLSSKCAILIDDTNLLDVREANSKFMLEHLEFSKIIDIITPCNRYPTWWNGIQVFVRG